MLLLYGVSCKNVVTETTYHNSSAAVPALATVHKAPPNTVWERIQQGQRLDRQATEQAIALGRLQPDLDWHRRHPNHVTKVSERSQRYIHHVVEQLEQRDLPVELALLPMVESAYDPQAYSHRHAAGMWQFIASTADAHQLRQEWWYDGRLDVLDSTDAALNYLEQLYHRFDDDWLLALAAYNAGQGTVSRAIRNNREQGLATDFWSLQLPQETRRYVTKLLALALLVDQPEYYNVAWHPVPNEPYFAVVEIKAQIELAKAAELAAIELDELHQLNPGFNRFATAPTGPHRLLVPVQRADHFATQLAALPVEERLQWLRYQVEPGDSLSVIAHYHNTDSDTLRVINGITEDYIQVGQTLLIPIADNQHYAMGEPALRQLGYTVQGGESLAHIASTHNVSVNDIVNWNWHQVSEQNYLEPGQRLVLYVE